MDLRKCYKKKHLAFVLRCFSFSLSHNAISIPLHLVLLNISVLIIRATDMVLMKAF